MKFDKKILERELACARLITKDEVMNSILKKLHGLSPDEILKECGITEYDLPVDMDIILEHFGISYSEKDFSEVEKSCPITIAEKGYILGAVVVDKQGVEIMTRALDTYNRKRFTTAHEFSHCCVHAEQLSESHVEFRFDFECKTSDREIAANTFAAELLMPESFLRNICRKYIFPVLSSLCDIFGVSANVMKTRLESLGINYYNDIRNVQGEADE